MSFRFFNSTGQEQIINSVADLPVGAIIDSALPNAPTGWLLCDGSSISRTGFPELFAAIGTFYGTVDANTFTLPDLTGQIIYARPYSLRTSNGLYVDDNSITSAKIATGAVTTTQILDGTVATADIANGAITSAKLASGVGGTALVVGSVSAATERTTTSGGFADVTSASFSLTVAANSLTIVSLLAELKGSAQFVYSCMNAKIGSSSYIVADSAFNANEPGDDFLERIQNTTYRKRTIIGGVHSSDSGTGAQTVKAQFAVTGGGIAYIKNVYLSAVNIPL